MNDYKSPEWIKFREEVIELYGGCCAHCQRGRQSGVVMQVHHKIYIPGNKIWEYPHDKCIALCKGCHAQEHGIIMPQIGWECVSADDLGGLDGHCELCNTSLRHLYLIHHDNWPSMQVGTDCCDRLTESTVASEFVKYCEKRIRFISSPRWKEDAFGKMRIKQNGISVAVTEHDGQFKLSFNGVSGDKAYASLLDAKKKVFEFTEHTDAAEILDKAKKVALQRKEAEAEKSPRRRTGWG